MTKLEELTTPLYAELKRVYILIDHLGRHGEYQEVLWLQEIALSEAINKLEEAYK